MCYLNNLNAIFTFTSSQFALDKLLVFPTIFLFIHVRNPMMITTGMKFVYCFYKLCFFAYYSCSVKTRFSEETWIQSNIIYISSLTVTHSLNGQICFYDLKYVYMKYYIMKTLEYNHENILFEYVYFKNVSRWRM